MKNLMAALARAYAAVTAFTVALAAILVAILFLSGALTKDRVEDALQALRAPKEKVQERKSLLSDEERLELERAQRQRQETLDLREKELGKLETRLAGQLAQVRQEQDDLEKSRKKILEEQGRLKKEQESLAGGQSDAEVAANVPILSRMDAPGIVAVLKEWDDTRFVRYLRAMRPSKAAEVLETVRTDPQFETEFRRIPEDAPPGAKTRAERLAEEFKKAP
jgi:septal ring factor EnvC (AmiA/AmiB activator)